MSYFLLSHFQLSCQGLQAPHTSHCLLVKGQPAAGLISAAFSGFKGLGNQKPQPRKPDCQAARMQHCNLWGFKK